MFGTRFQSKMDAYRLYLIAQGIGSFAFALIFTVTMIYQATVIGLTPLQLVLVGTTLEVVVFIFEIPTGIVADLYSRRLSVTIGYALVGLGFLIEGSIPTFGAVLLCQLVWGIGVTFISGAEQAWITDEIGVERAGRAFLRASQFGAIGGLAGIALAAALGSIQINLSIIVGSLCLIALAGFLVVRMPETGFHPTPKEDRSTFQHMGDTFRQGVRLIRTRRILLMIVAVGLILGLYSEGYDRLNVQHILTNFSFPTVAGIVIQPVVWYSLMQGVSLLLGLVVTEAIQRRINTEDRRAINRALLWLTVPMIGGLIVFGLTESLLIMVLAYWLFNVMRGLVGTLYGAWSNHYFDSNVRATMNSMMGQVDAIGQIVGGPAVGGFAQGMTDRVGLSSALRLTMILCAAILSPVVYVAGRALRYDTKQL